MLGALYNKFILKYPLLLLLLTLTAILLFSSNISKLEIDASAQTLLLEDDKDLKYLHQVEKHFKSDNILIIAYKPKSPLLSEKSLDTLERLSLALEKLPSVDSVDSLLTVPLLYSPPQELEDLLHNTRTLQSKDMNFSLAKNEFLTSPLYKDSLVNKSFTVTSILIHLKKDLLYPQLLEQKSRLAHKAKNASLSKEEEHLYEDVKIAFKKHRDIQRIIDAQNISNIRNIMKAHSKEGQLYLGGVQMISNDIITFVKSDLRTYGFILILLLIVVLGRIFRQIRWVILPLLICALSVIAITSALGYWGWEITVISSNFISLQLIITISIVLHLIVRYQELLRAYPHASQHKLVLNTMLSKATPTFFAILTTIAGFSSLLFSHIKPIINLGWMMSAGIALSLLISFIVFPTVLILLKKRGAKEKKSSRFSLARVSTSLVLKDKKGIFLVTFIVLLFTLTGASKLIVENSFINYFKKDTSIYKGMKIIDQELGGTTPLDVILTFVQEDANSSEVLQSEPSEENSFEDEFENPEDEEQYWFTDEKIAIIQKVHNYLYALKDTGDVKSFSTILDTGKILNKNKNLDAVEIAILYKKLPQKYRDIILLPYVNIAENELRFSTRIRDSHEDLRRNALIQKIHNDLSTMLNPQVVQFKLSNLMLIYNNMLQSLFTSQITTLSFVLVILFVMFLLLFRSLKLTLIALLVNIIPIGLIFGFMGWFEIPLDIMTITIAAIAMGIGVDDTIHYIHRFEVEFIHQSSYAMTIAKTNKSIGYAMYYTSLTVIIGFSILVLSNLIPTIYFALLTMLVMAAALISNLILLPKLLLLIKPLTKNATIQKIDKTQ